jgi:hypothetical protein
MRKQKNVAVSNDADCPLTLLRELPHPLEATTVIAALDTDTTTATTIETRSQLV